MRTPPLSGPIVGGHAHFQSGGQWSGAGRVRGAQSRENQTLHRSCWYCRKSRHRTRQPEADHAVYGRLWPCDNGWRKDLGYRNTRQDSMWVPWKVPSKEKGRRLYWVPVPSANMAWTRCHQGWPGVGAERHRLGQSHKFADGNVHIAGAKWCGVNRVLTVVITRKGCAYLIALRFAIHVMNSYM